jgi:Zn-dependent protease with chaperone function
MVTLVLLQGVLNTGTGSASGCMRLFMSHPPLDERIAALQSST